MNSTIFKLEELTGRLPELEDMSQVFGPIVAINSKAKPGRPSFGFGAYRDADVGIMRLFIAEGDQVDAHVNSNEHQWIIVITGKLRIKTLTIDGDCISEQVISKYESIHIAPNVPHVVIADEHTWCCTLTMPPAAGYPNAAGACQFEASKLEVMKSITKDNA